MHERFSRRGRASKAVLAAAVAWAAALCALVGTVPAASAAPAEAAAPSVRVTAADAASCTAGVNEDVARSRMINLVLDDSLSMFEEEDGELIDRWSKAKYALEVFAAMLGRDDTLNVYLMSNFGGGRESGAAVVLDGAMSASARVAQIHNMELNGRGTPYASVQKAHSDLVAATSADKWLVVLSDGEFQGGYTAGRVQEDLFAWTAAGATEDGRLSIAFLGIGPDAPAIKNDPAMNVHFAHARESQDLLATMTGFANLIFQRDVIPQDPTGTIVPDVPLREVMVFNQGPDATVGDAQDAAGTHPPSKVDVSWVANKDIIGRKDKPISPKVDRSLKGALATFENLAAGRIVFDAPTDDRHSTTVFFRPDVQFGVELRNAEGEVVAADKAVSGEYTVRFGFVDRECAFIDSDTLGTVAYTAMLLRDGEVVEQGFQSGDKITLDRGQVQLDVEAAYLKSSRSHARIDLTVLQEARPTGFDMSAPPYSATGLVDADPAPITLDYAIEENGARTPFTDEEWASVTPEAFAVSGPPGLVFDVALGERPGEVLLTPRPVDGDVYAVPTGDVPITVTAEHTYDEQLYTATLDTTFAIADDISWWDRLMHWFGTIGWKLLLGLLLLLLILGYIIKPRFSKKIKRRPTVTGVPISFSQRAETGNGKFQVLNARRFLPYLADTATLSYTPRGIGGFRTMKLKARRGGKMVLLNWKAIAERKNVAINGTDLNEETRRPPLLSPSTNITATVPNQVRYELYLNN